VEPASCGETAMNDEKSYHLAEQKITNSGLFKLNNASAPIGIITLKSDDKSLSAIGKYDRYAPHILRIMIGEISREISSHLYGPRDYNSLEKVMDDFENEFISFLSDKWDFRPEDLNPQYEAFVKKAKKSIKKNLSQFEKAMTRRDKKPTLRREQLVENIHSIIEKNTKFSATDINHYIAHLLIDCGIETGTHRTVFDKIDRQYYRYKARLAKDHA
jgi:hypothetical protein